MYIRHSVSALASAPVLCSLLLLMALLCPQWGGAAQRELTVATDLWPPFRLEKQGHLEGIDMDMWAELGKRLDLRVRIIRAPWGRCINMLRDGTAQAMSGLARTPEREAFISFVNVPYHVCSAAFYTLTEREWLIRNYDDLSSRSVAHVLGAGTFEPFASDPKLIKFGVTTESQLPPLLLSGRVDLFIAADCQMDYDLTRQRLTDAIRKEPYSPASQSPLYIGFSRKANVDVELQQAIEDTMNQMLLDGTIETIVKRYMAPAN